MAEFVCGMCGDVVWIDWWGVCVELRNVVWMCVVGVWSCLFCFYFSDVILFPIMSVNYHKLCILKQ